MIALQRFKRNDETEEKILNAGVTILEELASHRQDFWNGAFTALPLGDVLYGLERDPLVGVILPETYRESYPAIHELFTRPSTFEFYLDVLKSVWGENATIEFVIPGPGRLDINIVALEVELQAFLARRIENNMYFFDEVETQDGETILFQGTLGIKTQREADALINEISAHGVITKINLTIED